MKHEAVYIHGKTEEYITDQLNALAAEGYFIIVATVHFVFLSTIPSVNEDAGEDA